MPKRIPQTGQFSDLAPPDNLKRQICLGSTAWIAKRRCYVGFTAGTGRIARDAQLEFHNMRAQLWWQFREALDPAQGEGVALPPDRRLAAQLAAPTWKLRRNAILIESTDEIRKRLGTSTDDADAVVLAWHKREDAVRRQMRTRRLNPGIGLGWGGGSGWMGT